MTDGIIQEVFKTMIDRYAKEALNLKDIHHYCSANEVSDLNYVKQQLIEKIKQYELLCYKDNGQPTTYVPKVRLIGDNQ